MRLVSFSPDGEQMLRSGIETAAGIADTRQVAELAVSENTTESR
jgi:hypothetical protein